MGGLAPILGCSLAICCSALVGTRLRGRWRRSLLGLRRLRRTATAICGSDWRGCGVVMTKSWFALFLDKGLSVQAAHRLSKLAEYENWQDESDVCNTSDFVILREPDVGRCTLAKIRSAFPAAQGVRTIEPTPPKKPRAKTTLSGDERAVVTALWKAWNVFLRLPEEHADDTDEFRRAIHAAQEKVFARPARREFK